MVSLDQEKCQGCGICGVVCPRHILVTEKVQGEKRTRVSDERLDLCMGCGQCVAVCPNDAVRVEGLPAEGFQAAPPMQMDYEDLCAFFSRRRSIRRYKDQPVERDVLRRIARAAGLAPCGAGRAATGALVIDSEDRLKELSNHIYRVYEGMNKALANPIGRVMVRHRAGRHNYGVLQVFVMPGMRWYIQWKNQGASDEILRDCRALMLFHTNGSEPSGRENCVVAAWHAIFAAETLGVGTCMNDLIPPICNRSPEIKEMLGLPESHEVMSSLTMGYPKFKYPRTVPRELVSLRFVE